MNVKRGMTGVCTLVSFLWGGYWTNMLISTIVDGDRIRFLNLMVYGLLLWWGFFCIGFGSFYCSRVIKKMKLNE
jgi:hypothetical protein